MCLSTGICFEEKKGRAFLSDIVYKICIIGFMMGECITRVAAWM